MTKEEGVKERKCEKEKYKKMKNGEKKKER